MAIALGYSQHAKVITSCASFRPGVAPRSSLTTRFAVPLSRTGFTILLVAYAPSRTACCRQTCFETV